MKNVGVMTLALPWLVPDIDEFTKDFWHHFASQCFIAGASPRVKAHRGAKRDAGRLVEPQFWTHAQHDASLCVCAAPQTRLAACLL